MKDREFLHNYWSNPADENLPERYLAETRTGRTQLLMEFCKQVGLKPKHTVLEIGCNIGRNLNALYNAGYKKLTGIDINQDAIDKMGEFFPDMKINTMVGPVEDLIRDLPAYDMVLSMTVFMHLHPSSEWVFEEVAKRTKRWLITVEDECNHDSERILSRQYKDIFENLGMECILVEKEITGMSAVYTARVFKK